MGKHLFVELLLDGRNFGGEPLGVGLELFELGCLGLDDLIALKDLLLDLRLGGVVVGDLVLERLVFFVLLDLVELDLEVVDLGLDALERVLVLLELNLGCPGAPFGAVRPRPCVAARAACRAASVLGPEPGGRAGPWRADAVGAGRGGCRRSRASVAVLSHIGFRVIMAFSRGSLLPLHQQKTPGRLGPPGVDYRVSRYSRGNPRAAGFGPDAAACGRPWPRSGGRVRGSP